jgi:transcriptional regulator with XRE-family HTH domain
MGLRTKLIKARERQGISRIDLAERLGMTRQYVMRVEEGLRNPSHETMVRWADELDISMDKFRDDEPQSQTAAE